MDAVGILKGCGDGGEGHAGERLDGKYLYLILFPSLVSRKGRVKEEEEEEEEESRI